MDRLSLKNFHLFQRALLLAGSKENFQRSWEKVFTAAHTGRWLEKLDFLLSLIQEASMLRRREVFKALDALSETSDSVLSAFWDALESTADQLNEDAELIKLLNKLAEMHALKKQKRIYVTPTFWLTATPEELSAITLLAEKVHRVIRGNLNVTKELFANLRGQFPSLEAFKSHVTIHKFAICKVQLAVGKIPLFSSEEARYCTKALINCEKLALDEKFIHHFLRTSLDFKRSHGKPALKAAIMSKVPLDEPELHIRYLLMQHLLEMGNRGNGVTKQLVAQEQTPHQLCQELLRIRGEVVALDPRTPAEQVSQFIAASNFPYGLTSPAANELADDLAGVLAKEEEIRSSTISELCERASSLRKKFESGQEKQGDILTLVAIGRRALFWSMGKYPFSVQVLAVLQMLRSASANMRGSLAQMKTGEGKSLSVALLAHCIACQGKSVDIITSSRYLARRDQEHFAPFFRRFGISTAHICTDNPPERAFDGQILFGVNTDFEFAYLRDATRISPQQRWTCNEKLIKRTYQVAIVDEVDNLLIDIALNSARIAIEANKSHDWIFLTVLKYVQLNRQRVEQALSSRHELEIALSDVTRALATARSTTAGEIQQFFTRAQLRQWLHSAYVACFLREEDRDYSIQKREIIKEGITHEEKRVVIVDWNNSGRFLEGCRWQQGVHEFVEAKHEIAIHRESFMPASINHSTYFSLYDQLFGLTGTIGGIQERNELKEIFRVDTFDVPVNRPRRYTQLPGIIASQECFFRKIHDEIILYQKLNRPLLILFATIKDTENFSDYLKSEQVVHQVLNEKQAENENFLISQAGAPRNITIATNTAGRGTDIVLQPASLNSGGLHVIFTFYPDNERVENQGFGRASRQGQPGSGQFILPDKDAAFARQVNLHGTSFSSLTASDQFNQMKSSRIETNKVLSEKRLYRAKIEQVHHEYLQEFNRQLRFWEDSLNTTTLLRIVEKLSTESQREISQEREQNMNRGSPIDKESVDHLLLALNDQSTLQERYLHLRNTRNFLKEHIRRIWAEKFYERSDQFTGTGIDCQLYRTKLKDLYEEVKEEWQQFLNNPIANFESLLHFAKRTQNLAELT